MDHEPIYRADLAYIHDQGYGFHAEICAPGILTVLEPVRASGGVVLEVGCGSGALTRHLVAAGHRIDPAAQLVLLAGAPDTPEIAEETEKAVADLRAARGNVVWVRGMLPAAKVRQMLSAATVFVCPSVYEPLGIVNLEAMACGTAVVASDVGGIPEVVDDGRTGLLVHYDEHAVDEFRTGLADAVNALLADPARAAEMGAAGRERAVAEFAWRTAAQRTVEIYRSVL